MVDLRVVGYVEDPGREPDLLTPQPLGPAPTVPALVALRQRLLRSLADVSSALPLKDREHVLARIDDPAYPGEAHVRDTVLGLHAG